MNIQQIEETLSIPDTALRCQRVLDEVQPVLHKLMDEFKGKYASEAPELLQYQVHTYEVTLRTTMHDARNPKYAEKKQDSDIGKKAFVELIDKQYFQSEYGVLSLELNGMERKLKMVLSSNFYPFWEAVRSQTNERFLTDLLGLLPDDLQVQVSDKDKPSLSKSELIPFIQQCVTEKRKPWFYFGSFIDFDHMLPQEELVKVLWMTWKMLEPLRRYLSIQAAAHAYSLQVMDLFNSNKEDIPVTLFGKSYLIKFEDTYDLQSNQRRQSFGIYEKGQLLIDGKIASYLRDPNEFLGVIVNGSGQLYINLRSFNSLGTIEWLVSKAFKKKKNNGPELNKTLQKNAMEALVAHNFKVDGSSFSLGIWDGENMQFTESIIEVKRRFIIAGLLFADCSEIITLPKDDYGKSLGPVDGGQDDDGDDGDLPEEIFAHDFDLANILNNVRESQLTYSDAIIRDFHLNLVSLEDKHFVILNGISGTGKTKLCLLYANAVYGKSIDVANPYLKVIPVRPDWTDSTSLFGYYSALEKRYVRTPFLNAILQATQEGKPMFIVLDEMNLARVEYYLSDYLSAIESRQPIRLHTEEHIIDVPQELQIPHNLYVIGTINVDETTHSISDKVLDRAFVMTLSDVDMEQFWETIGTKYKEALHMEWQLIQQLHEKLRHNDLHFGYRTMNEMIRKLYANRQLASGIRMDTTMAVDRVITEKVLPKIRGDERIGPLLEKLIAWTTTSFGDKSESLVHLVRMKGELDRYGATQFWR